MELEQAILERRSIRAFKPDPVPAEVLKEILDIARWTPSFANTQPWEFTVVGGELLEELRRRLREVAASDPEGKPDVPWPELVDPFLSRRRELGFALYDAQGIPRDDREKREAWRLFGIGFFDAPNVIVISLDRCFTAWGMYDLGAIAFATALLAHARGLGTCPQAAPTRYPWLFRELLGIPENKLVVLALAIGYPDSGAPVNCFPRPRASLDELVTWKGINP